MVEQEFLGYINENRLFGSMDRVLLAVSGGLDSMVMAELFYRTNQSFAIAHVNFGLRGAESDADAVFVQNKAEHYGVPFHQIRFDTAAIAAERGISIQMAARDLRYSWFANLCRQRGYTCLATAHHKNDVLETLLLNLTRGTGLAGLHGIAPRQERLDSAVLVRPLLFATRAQLAEYARVHALPYREDRSNADDKYARNRLRHHVVPVLHALNPGLWQTLSRTVERLRAAETLVEAELARSWAEVVVQHGQSVFLPTAKLFVLPEVAFRLAAWLKPFGFGEEQTNQMLDSLTRPVGQVFASPTHQITHDRLADGNTGLLLEFLQAAPDYGVTLTEWPDAPVDVAGQFTLTIDVVDKPADFRPPADSRIVFLDAERLAFPLAIRPWKQGDRLRPLGLSGHKLVSDLLNDMKLTRSERQHTAVLLCENQIAWVIGRRIAHAFRVTQHTRHIAKIEFQASRLYPTGT